MLDAVEKQRRRMVPQNLHLRKLMQGKITRLRVPHKQGRNISEIRNDAAADYSTWTVDGRDRVPVRPVGMAGGLILIGVLLTILPLPPRWCLHAITQMLPRLARVLVAQHISGGGRDLLIGCASRWRRGRSPLCAGQAGRALLLGVTRSWRG